MSHRLIAFDFDSTLIDGEIIDELAREAGAYDRVAELTLAAMQGDMDFAEAMRLRLAAMTSLHRDDVERMAARIELRRGARRVLEEVRARGYRIAIISGSFLGVLRTILEREEVEPDHLYANELRFDDSGRLLEEADLHVVSNKGDILRELQDNLEIRKADTVAVGDGATDVAMFEQAGSSISVHGKPAARAAATFAFDGDDLSEILRYMP